MPTSDDRLRLKGQHDIVAAVPYLVGFHPQDSLVCLALRDNRVTLAVRLDLSGRDDDPGYRQAVDHAAEVIAHNGPLAIIVGYGTPGRVDPAVALLTGTLAAANVEVFGVLRVTDGRYYCLDCDGECPADGVAYDPSASMFPAEAVYRGMAPLPSRAALADLIEPITGPRRETMRAASDDAVWRLTEMLYAATPARTGAPIAGWRTSAPPARVMERGVTAVQQAFDAAARAETLSDGDAAWLTAVLLIPEVRDHAWKASDGSDAHRELWIDITRRAMPVLTPAPACLLAITAYLAGDGALARIAADRALHADPGYSLAHLLSRALQAGVSPHVWREATAGS